MERSADMMINPNTIPRIIDILSLSKSTPVIQRCISELERITTLGTSVDMIVGAKQILSIWRLRIEMCRARYGNIIEDGDDVINALEKETGEKVRLLAFLSDKESFLIFTDPELERLIGCMSLEH